MKKLLLILLCLPLLFSCGDVDKIKILDGYSLINQSKIKNKIDDLKSQKEINITKIESDSIELHKLQNNPAEQEKFAREKFLIKKENEDIFIIKKNE